MNALQNAVNAMRTVMQADGDGPIDMTETSCMSVQQETMRSQKIRAKNREVNRGLKDVDREVTQWKGETDGA